MTALGSNAHLFAQPHRRQDLRWAFETALGCGPVAAVDYPGIAEPMLVVRFPDGRQPQHRVHRPGARRWPAPARGMARIARRGSSRRHAHRARRGAARGEAPRPPVLHHGPRRPGLHHRALALKQILAKCLTSAGRKRPQPHGALPLRLWHPRSAARWCLSSDGTGQLGPERGAPRCLRSRGNFRAVQFTDPGGHKEDPRRTRGEAVGAQPGSSAERQQ
jgi:hypothetical protein